LKKHLLDLEAHASLLKKRIFDLEKQVDGFKAEDQPQTDGAATRSVSYHSNRDNRLRPFNFLEPLSD
jgi:hypothetical protein